MRRFLASCALLLAAVGTIGAQDSLRIVHLGDINFARDAARWYVIPGRGAEIFAGLRDELERADLAIANLESVLMDRGDFADPRGTFVFAGPHRAAELLRDAGFDMVTTANNHTWDFGRAAMLESLGHLERVGLRHAGSGPDLDAAWKPAILEARGRRVAVFSITRIFNAPGLQIAGQRAECCIAWGDTIRLRDAVRALRDSAGAEIVLVSIHHGTEYVGVPRRAEREFARALARTGVDAVIGHHPHVPQGVEWINGVPVIHSLGNLVFLQNDPWTRVGFMADLRIAPDRSISLTMRPVAATFTPKFLSGRDSIAAMRHLDSLSALLRAR